MRPEQPLETFAWSSYGDSLKPPTQRPRWLRVGRLPGEKGIPKDSEAGRQMFALQVERRRAEEGAADYEPIRRSWYLGSEQFGQELLAAASERVGLNHYGQERQETDEQKAERWVKQELGLLGWSEEKLRACRKGDQRKVAIARRLRQETTMSLKWIAHRLDMGSWTYVSNLLQTAPPDAVSAQQRLLLCQS